jgi:hypothetical protein
LDDEDYAEDRAISFVRWVIILLNVLLLILILLLILKVCLFSFSRTTPHLQEDDIQAVLHYAAEAVKQEHVYPLPV